MKRISLLSFALLLAACDTPQTTQTTTTTTTGTTGAAPAATGQTRPITVGSSQDVPSLNFWSESHSLVTEIGGMLYSGMTYVDDQGQVRPDLAESVPTEGSGLTLERDAQGVPQRMTVRWTLREGLTWSDGSPLTTEDVAFSHRVYMDQRLPVPSREGVPTAINVVDARTFDAVYDTPYLYYNLGLGFPVLPRADWEPVYASVEGADQEAFNNNFLGNPLTNASGGPRLTSGPFTLTEWRRGASMTLTRNPNHWRQPEVAVPADRVIYRFFADANALTTSVLAGQLDAVSAVGVTADQNTLNTLRRAEANYDVIPVSQADWEHIDINQFSNVDAVRNLGLDDKRTRQAISYAINRETMIREVVGGLGTPSVQGFNSQSPAFLERSRQAYPYDPERARALLAEMGWRPGPDGILVRNGVPFRFELKTTSGNALRERLQAFLQQNLREVGIDVRLNNLPAAVLFAPEHFNRASEGAWTGGMLFTWNSQPLALSGDLWAANDPATDIQNDFIPTAANGYAGQNIGGWQNAEYQRLWEQARREFDTEARYNIYRQMQEILLDEVPGIGLYERQALVVRRKGLNWDFNAFTRNGGWNGWNLGWSQ